MNKIRTIFIGSGIFGVPILEELIKLDFIKLEAIITQPDKPSGRKKLLTPTPIKEYILNSNKYKDIEITQPTSIKDSSEEIINKHSPQLIIVASYGQIIPDNMLNYPVYGCLNLHGSLLPLLRGAVPIPMAILKGFKETGVTLQKMINEMDKGPIISIKKINISSMHNSVSLMSELAILGSTIIKEDLKKWVLGELKEEEQDESKATYCYKNDLDKQKAEIKFDNDLNLSERMVKAYNPWPIAWIRLPNEKILKIFSASYINEETSISFNKLNVNVFNQIKLIANNKKLYLILNKGILELTEVQLEGKSRDKAINFLYLGHKS